MTKSPNSGSQCSHLSVWDSQLPLAIRITRCRFEVATIGTPQVVSTAAPGTTTRNATCACVNICEVIIHKQCRCSRASRIILGATAFAWLYEISNGAPQEALRDLDRAVANKRIVLGKPGKSVAVSKNQTPKTKRHAGKMDKT